MAFKLTLANFTAGLEADAAKTQLSLQFFAGLTTPTTEAVMRAAAELLQLQAYSNEGWLDLMSQLANISIDESVLTAQERSVMNVIRSVQQPSPSLDICGVVPVVTGLTSMAFRPFVGSLTWQHQIEVKLDPSTTCDIKSVDVTLVGAPASIPVTFKCTFDKATAAGRIFSRVWIAFGANPSGNNYTISLDFKDENDLSIDVFTPSYSPWVAP